MRRRNNHVNSNVTFKDGLLSIPGYTFQKAFPWNDTGSGTLLCEGSSLKDGSLILAKVAPIHSNASICLEREAHILGKMAESAEAVSATLRMIDFVTIPHANGDCVALLLQHPGLNLLGRYFPPSKVNDFLLSDPNRPKPDTTFDDTYMLESDMVNSIQLDSFDVIDLASFLEVRANAFHHNAHTGVVRIVHFGNRAISLEEAGGASGHVLKSIDEMERYRIKEALCYLAPEQSGSTDVTLQDHRTDLYSLGVMLWTLIVGQGILPFEGEPAEILHALVQKKPLPVHEVRGDVPSVIGDIIDKLMDKSMDARYQSAFGLKADLLECQRRLLAVVSSSIGQPTELIPAFEIAAQDRYSTFSIPLILFGREKELEMIRNVTRNTLTSFSRDVSASKGLTITSSTGTDSQDTGTGTGTGTGGDGHSDSASSRSVSSAGMRSHEGSPKGSSSRLLPTEIAGSPTNPSSMNEGLRRVVLKQRTRAIRSHVIVVSGPAGIGKSSLVLANQIRWRSHGLWGQAKFQRLDNAPYEALLGCISSILRQLMANKNDLHTFVTSLQERMGQHLQNVPLLYQGIPEIKDILEFFSITIDSPQDRLATSELRARFQSLLENMLLAISEIKTIALFFDDLHEADDSCLDMVEALINARIRMLIFITIRDDDAALVDRVKSMSTNKSRVAWMNLDPLSYAAMSSLVSKTLHRNKEDCTPLSRLVYTASAGNAFVARNILHQFHRLHYITFDWARNSWQFDINAIEANQHQHIAVDPMDPTYLVSHFRELAEESRKYLIWASFFGSTFQVTEVAILMEWEDTSGSSSEEDSEDQWDFTKTVSMLKNRVPAARSAMRGLQAAVSEGWIIQRGRDLCSFAHDRYRHTAQLEAQRLPEPVVAKMSFRIVLMMLHDNDLDVHRIAEHAKRCLPLLLEHPKREELLGLTCDAGDSAWTRGAHERALHAYTSAITLLRANSWEEHPRRSFQLTSRLAALLTWKGDLSRSDELIEECLVRINSAEERAQVLRLRSNNHWLRNNYTTALQDTLLALQVLGVNVTADASKEDADAMFEVVKNEILAIGFDGILSIPRGEDSRTDLAIALLGDAGFNAYWGRGEGFVDVTGLTTVRLALHHGMSPGTALGFLWALAAAERREMFRFASELGKMALHLADLHGGSMEKCRARVLYCAMVAPYDNVHLRMNVGRLIDARRYGQSAGDRVFTGFASLHMATGRLWICDHLSEVVATAEECVSDIVSWTPGADAVILARGVLNCVRALGGYTDASSVDTIFDTENFRESEYYEQAKSTCSNYLLSISWYNCFKVAGLFCTGFIEAAAVLGFSTYEYRDAHPNHRHSRYAAFFHSLSLIECIRRGRLSETQQSQYLKQVELNQAFIRKWLPASPVNVGAWVALVDAECASLFNDMDALKKYDIAIKLATMYDWHLEAGFGLYLQGCHLVRNGVDDLGGELQRRGIDRQASWGAQGIVQHLRAIVGASEPPTKRSIFKVDAEVQTESVQTGFLGIPSPSGYGEPFKESSEEETEVASMTASDLASILRWSKEISTALSLSSALQRLTEIVTGKLATWLRILRLIQYEEVSSSRSSCIVMTGQSGAYNVATLYNPPEMCQVFENPRTISSLEDPLQRSVLHLITSSKQRVYLEDAGSDHRFALEAEESPCRSVICLPISNNRGQVFGAVYVSSEYAFSRNTLSLLSILCQQASISIASALLFRSVQAGTRENLKMIAAQREALEAARRSREDALKAAKIKSNFLASMSHELRTPFSSFYGLLDLLNGTELNPGQSEIVHAAKQSCELLLKIIDSILDYSKLEASAVKLEYSGFPVEDTIADCMELLLPMAVKKLDLSFNIDRDVPSWVVSDYARIRQVLMNLIGNAVKFTPSGSVIVQCGIDNSAESEPGAVQLKFTIQDTGIGLSSNAMDMLFVPFQQADNSSTRRFGGTGLGLSISRQLVQLMGGVIGVSSELDVGSVFWFKIPAKIYDGEEVTKADAELSRLRGSLMTPRPLRVLVCSSSNSTLTLLNTMLAGFDVASVDCFEEIKFHLNQRQSGQALDYIILDDQSDHNCAEVSQRIGPGKGVALEETRVIQLYTPTVDHLGGPATFHSATPGVVKMTKPPRRLRLLHLLASLKNNDESLVSTPSTDVSKAMDAISTARRTLFGNVLIAEDNPVARNLLIKQLERHNLNVTATTNGHEAIEAWESHEPGFFAVALFDHHMPVCDGVEAAKRIRFLENSKQIPITLPVIALSADCQESTKQLCMSAGMNAFFSKPLRKGDLVTLLSSFTPSTAQSIAFQDTLQ
ncbi:dual-domain HisK Mak2 protein kinase [Coniophora puteana RWD-64-598 SS2]|uniref:Dual-domain HisK Mak2 protein kinase n=1 Tax=Coniophora puteana (strain RWD-64-598) TaxID=741705 RepID=A0A5M3N4R1_CONPW|nr:dual-domain HisK Mak2 protein kinase [Coniophora puteana RWD-64-598 SS2]EIW86383.1 dual-domain HisK Mak2 protein kinase [Coniophora puteana RWD-64-598 SS2]